MASIYLHLQKISECYQLRISTLLNNYTIKSLLERRYTENMTPKQQLKIKGSIINANNHLNGIFPSFNSLSYEFSPRTWFFLVVFHFVIQITKTKKAGPFTFANLINVSFMDQLISNQLWLSQTLVLRTISLCQLCIFIFIQILSKKQFIMLSMLHLQKQNYSLLDVVLTRLFKSLMLLISSLLQMQCM